MTCFCTRSCLSGVTCSWLRTGSSTTLITFQILTVHFCPLVTSISPEYQGPKTRTNVQTSKIFYINCTLLVCVVVAPNSNYCRNSGPGSHVDRHPYCPVTIFRALMPARSILLITCGHYQHGSYELTDYLRCKAWHELTHPHFIGIVTVVDELTLIAVVPSPGSRKHLLPHALTLTLPSILLLPLPQVPKNELLWNLQHLLQSNAIKSVLERCNPWPRRQSPHVHKPAIVKLLLPIYGFKFRSAFLY